MRPQPRPLLEGAPAPATAVGDLEEPLPRGDRRKGIETAVLAGGTFLAFAALGIWLTVHLKVVAYDGAFRLAHAFFVWYGAPGKLSAIGFVWPPLMTLVFLPFAAIKPLSTSLIALPLTSALAAAGTIAVLNRLLDFLGLPRLARYPLLVAFAVNPMFVHYATNGMSEMFTFFWLVLALYQFLRWQATRRVPFLAMAGIAMALGVLSRYELLPYALVMGVAIVALTARMQRAETESSLLLFAMPIAYAGAAWMFFNWLIVGDPLSFLHHEVTERFVLEKGRSVTQGGAGGATVSDPVTLSWMIVKLYWKLFLPQLLVLVPLTVISVRKRSAIGLMLVAMILLNPLMTALFVKNSDLSLLQLRFNTRSMPVTIVAIGWLFTLVGGRWRAVVAMSSVAALFACVPLSWQTMKTYPYVFAEHDFIRALATGTPHDVAGIAGARRMATYVNAHVHGTRQVLVDDAQTFLPLLVGGQPERYFNRIDKGDRVWERILDEPRGKVGWMLVPRRQGPLADLILNRYPAAATGKVPFLRVAFEAGNMVLLRVAPPADSPRASPVRG